MSAEVTPQWELPLELDGVAGIRPMPSLRVLELWGYLRSSAMRAVKLIHLQVVRRQ